MTGQRFTDFLREAAAVEWSRMQEHPFVRAIEADALPPDVLKRYLIIECGFVDAAISIFGYALVQAPDLATRRELVTVLRGLTEDQMPFFNEAFAELGVAGEPWREPAPPAAGMLREGMLGFAAHGGFAEVMTAMLAAEWTYREFCGRCPRSANQQRGTSPLARAPCRTALRPAGRVASGCRRQYRDGVHAG